ncbi:MAG: hypothetical protein LBI56_02555 [Puniceicoccales bacterium]|nr:hypothetical protein [Puniceicoccales bacterium]
MGNNFITKDRLIDLATQAFSSARAVFEGHSIEISEKKWLFSFIKKKYEVTVNLNERVCGNDSYPAFSKTFTSWGKSDSKKKAARVYDTMKPRTGYSVLCAKRFYSTSDRKTASDWEKSNPEDTQNLSKIIDDLDKIKTKKDFSNAITEQIFFIHSPSGDGQYSRVSAYDALEQYGPAIRGYTPKKRRKQTEMDKQICKDAALYLKKLEKVADNLVDNQKDEREFPTIKESKNSIAALLKEQGLG